MCKLRVTLVAVFLCAVLYPGTCCCVQSGELVRDPYEILETHFETTSTDSSATRVYSLYREISTYVAGVLEIIHAKEWVLAPARFRRETDYDGEIDVRGCDGKLLWQYRNEKLTISSDSLEYADRRVDSLWWEGVHFHPDSSIFDIQYTGLDTVEGHECFVLRVGNMISPRIEYKYIDTVNYLERRKISETPDLRSQMTHLEYDTVGGFVFPVLSEWLHLADSAQMISRATKIVVNPDIDTSLFCPPAQH